ncbi:MAG: phosphoglucosamine mutase [Bacteroidota bacterium]
MPLIKSISGFRGTLGGRAGENLTAQDIVESVAAFGSMLLQRSESKIVVIGRDGRPSGPVVSQLAAATLQMLGLDVIDLGYATTPTVEMAVPRLAAAGGIILSASHNPVTYNALKLLGSNGEFISAADGQEMLALLESGAITYAAVDKIGSYRESADELVHHVQAIVEHPLVAVDAIKAAGFKLVLDAVNSVGTLAIPMLCDALGVDCQTINGQLNGQFAHNPEPLPAHLGELMDKVKAEGADLGVAVDPDVDRLALVGPGGQWIGEEYTLVTVADYVLRHEPGPVVSNLSSSRALADLATSFGQTYAAAKVGEVNVVAKMKEIGATIGGEGNGGIIDPRLHYGRDSLIGLALVLSHLAISGKTINELRAGYPQYEMVKDKIQLTPSLDVDAILAALPGQFAEATANTEDGVKLDFKQGWVHLRKSNTEPIVRVYAEGETAAVAQDLADQVKRFVLA